MTLSGGHLAVDFASGSVPALLPFLALEVRPQLHGDGGADARRCSSPRRSSQPLFGLWSDRRGAMWLLPGGVALAGVGIGPRGGRAALRRSSSLLVFVAGIGVAAYHPEGAKFAAYASGQKRASGMSYFNIGGNTGYALGPIVVTPLVLWLGLERRSARDDPGARLRGGRCCGRCPTLRRIVPAATARRAAQGEDDVRAMSLLAVVIALAQRRVVRAAHLRAALGRRERRHGGGGGPRALADARLRRGRHARARPGRRSHRPAPHAARHPGGAPLPDRRLRRGRRSGRHAGADARRPVRRRHVRGDDGAEPALPAAPRRDGERALRRARDGARRDRRRRCSERSPTRSTSRPRSTSPPRRRRSGASSASSSRRPSRGRRPPQPTPAPVAIV